MQPVCPIARQAGRLLTPGAVAFRKPLLPVRQVAHQILDDPTQLEFPDSPHD